MAGPECTPGTLGNLSPHVLAEAEAAKRRHIVASTHTRRLFFSGRGSRGGVMHALSAGRRQPGRDPRGLEAHDAHRTSESDHANRNACSSEPLPPPPFAFK